MAEQKQIYRLQDLDVQGVNRVLALLGDRLDKLEGFRGDPLFTADVNVDGNRILNVADPVEPTDVATKSYADAGQIPVGFCLLSVVETDPGELIGYGTWELISRGQFLVGHAATGTFSTVLGTGGTETHSHTIDPPPTTSGAPSATALIGAGAAGAASDAHTHDIDIPSFSSDAASHLPPYCVVYVWRRTA